MTAAEYIAFLLAVMAVGVPHVLTPEPTTANGRCACSDCNAP